VRWRWSCTHVEVIDQSRGGGHAATSRWSSSHVVVVTHPRGAGPPVTWRQSRTHVEMVIQSREGGRSLASRWSRTQVEVVIHSGGATHPVAWRWSSTHVALLTQSRGGSRPKELPRLQVAWKPLRVFLPVLARCPSLSGVMVGVGVAAACSYGAHTDPAVPARHDDPSYRHRGPFRRICLDDFYVGGLFGAFQPIYVKKGSLRAKQISR
jgi:hypothetical protein